MAETPVLRFPISGQEDGSFLVEVSSNGSRPLDLKLIGSESTAVFLLKLRHKKIDEYKASPSQCTDEEWQQILTSTFVDLKPVPDIEIRADVQSDGTSVALSFRKNIQGITQRLGSVTLNESDRTEISPFNWCVSAIASRTRVTDELAAAAAKIESLEDSIKELKAQLDEFITTKEEDETQMLEKFRDLLNEKKLKIRKQHRLLATAKVDPDKLTGIVGHNAGPSRSGKRKVSIKEEEEDESDDGFDKMDVDSANTGNQTESGSNTDEDRPLSTDNDATASDPDPDTDDEPPTAAEIKRKRVSPPGRITRPKASASKKTAPPTRSTRAATRKRAAPVSDADYDDDDDDYDDDEDDAPPPPRALPFMKAKKTAAPPKPADDDETQSDDDSEL